MGIQERKEREKNEIREKIFLAAEKLFNEKGYENVSMRKIANEIEYSLPVIYHYFGSKADILSALYDKRNGLLLDAMKDAAKMDTADPRDRVKAMGVAYMEFAFANPSYYELAFTNNVLRHEKSIAYRDEKSNGFLAYGVLRDAVVQCVQAGYFAGEDAGMVCRMLWAGIHGAASLMIAHPDFEWGDRTEFISGLISRLIDKK